MRVLVAGWFSFEHMGATAGDLLARDLVSGWLEGADIPHDVANISRFSPGVDWRRVDPNAYSHVVFVCGPVGNGPPLVEFLDRFSGSKLAGLDVTMLDPLDEWNPFDLLIERDSTRTARPDFTFLASTPKLPVVSLVLIHPQPEYGEADLHAEANRRLEKLAEELDCARLRIDTQLDTGTNPLRSPGEVTAMLGRSDVVLTTRLHGLALGLRSGIPVLAIDPVAGGAKITRQAEALQWPFCYSPDTPWETLRSALDTCLSAEGPTLAKATAKAARAQLAGVEPQFLEFIASEG